MLTLTSSIPTWAHRVPASAKMAALCLWTALIFHLPPLGLTLAAATLTVLILTCGTTFATTSARMLRPLAPFVLIIAVWHLATRDPQGITILLRMITAVAAANFVTMTTRLSDMIAVLTTLTRPFPFLRNLPLAIALTIRFIPVMVLKLQDIRQAWRARSPRRPGWRIMVPALLATIDDADRVAEALRARGGAG
jgi:biotin transport system permease protein